ncbi:uncharacterized protein ACRADG_010020 isoform 1-T1 [Cochliomyia hominivorax]
MESISFLNTTHLSYQQLQRLRYFISENKRKTFIQRPCKNKQRLIPLTRRIVKAMNNFNASNSSTSISEKPAYNTFSITSLVRGEVQNILQELSISDQFIRKEEIDDLIEKCLKEKITIIQESDAKINHMILSDFDLNQEFEMDIEALPEDKEKNMLIVENIQILEQRITTLEERLSSMLQILPKLRHIRAQRFKVNTNALKEELRNMIYKMEKLQEEQTSVVTVNEIPEKYYNLYDDIYYSEREYNFNLLNYKKSLETMQLNQKPKLNPYVRPLSIILPEQKGKPKRSMFLVTNDVCI